MVNKELVEKVTDLKARMENATWVKVKWEHCASIVVTWDDIDLLNDLIEVLGAE